MNLILNLSICETMSYTVRWTAKNWPLVDQKGIDDYDN